MWTEERLNKMLTTPSEALSGELGRLEGDILVLGAGGKMGPTLCVLAKNALRAAGVEKRVIAVSRFSDPLVVELLRENGVEMISADLLAPGALDSLPDAENVIYMAGKKFGTDGNEYATWAMNTWLPSRVAERYQNSRIVVFSSGNLYPKVGVHSGGATEETRTEPVGEYCMSLINSGDALKLMSFTPTLRYVILSSGFRISLGFSSSKAREREKVPKPSRFTLYPMESISVSISTTSVNTASVVLSEIPRW